MLPRLYRECLIAAACAALVAVGCSAPAAAKPSATPDPTIPVADTEVSIPNPTPTGETPLPPDIPTGLPADFTPNELAAAKSGTATYSGYNCTYSANSCGCDKPVVQKAGFSFLPGDRLTYQFKGDTYGAAWDMTRINPDEWGYAIKLGADESANTPGGAGSYFFVLTFTASGFKITQREDLGQGNVITCPDAVFTRMGSSQP